MGSPNRASRRWVWQQSELQVGGDTFQRPGGDAAVVRVHGSKKALAITTDCTPRYCYADPYEGGKQAVAEAYRNLCAVGAKPLAITNCLNFGNPQRPEIMGQFVGCIEGMAEACRALDFPVVSGNVSLYNETKNEDGSSLAILPTPAIGGVGLLEDWEKSATIAFKEDGDEIWLIGGEPAHLGRSLWLALRGLNVGSPPPVDLGAERRNGETVRSLIASGRVNAVHDISDGGLLVAVAEMALAGNKGAAFNRDVPEHAEFMFGEDQGRYLVTAPQGGDLYDALSEAGVPHMFLGNVTGDAIRFCRLPEVSIADLRAAHEGFFPKLMGSELTPEF
jgi:phosphoribosylformylglycinamidine synthase